MPTDASIESASTSNNLSYRKSHIMVPEHIVQEVMDDPRFSTDLAFSTNAFNHARHAVRNPPLGTHSSVNKIGADYLFPNSPRADKWRRERHFLLHIVAELGDVLLAYEYLRLGLDPDIKDLHGRTPIWFALQAAVKVHTTPDNVMAPQEKVNRLARYTRVARLLIEQHIDVNQSHDGVTPLILACKARDWETISLLLEHGAIKNFATKTYFSTDKHRKKFMELVSTKSLTEGQERPARVCPCWSGKVLPECHGIQGRHPYPLSFLCVCGSKKSHESCCARKTPVFEYWEGTHLVPYSLTTADKPASYQKLGRAMQSLYFGKFKYRPDGTLRDLDSFPDVPFAALDNVTLEMFRQEMIKLNLVDPAFAYAMSKYRFPLNAGVRNWKTGQQVNWNRTVDEYIASGVDSRPVFEIERAAKIGQWGGPLVRECEGPECGKLEFRDVQKMLKCSRCHITPYCSKECQTADWKNHKSLCGTENQITPFLPSQDNINNYMIKELSKEPEYKEYMSNWE
uniref:MYND-type domain-containing protein n=1 Tax=Psilocybe cubensis TaxID=181762 RepID=A0A8H7XPA3_PSICU